MGNQKSYFAIGNKLFWGLIVIVILFAVLKLNPGIFKGDKIIRDIIVQDSLSKINWDEKVTLDSLNKINLDSIELVSKDSLNLDSLKVPKDEYFVRVWKWRSFDGKDYVLNFRIKQSDYTQASILRESSDPGPEIWVKMYENDKSGLKEMVNQYRDIIIKNRLNGMEALNMVVTSVQSIPYVLISNIDCPIGMEYTNDCRPRKNSPGGCCGNILPWGVYSPIEYAVNGSGDCDTKSLFACVILKELNLGFYDVAMLTGDTDGGPHAMLGVNIINPPYNDVYVNDFTRSKYYAWETTAEGIELGQNVWKTWNNWVVVNL